MDTRAWSAMVVALHKEGLTKEEIIRRMAIPIVNERYVNNLFRQRRTLCRVNTNPGIRRARSTPAAGTQMRKVYDMAQSLGGNAALMRELKETSYSKMAIKCGVPLNAVLNYTRDFIYCNSSRYGKWHGEFKNVAKMLEHANVDKPKQVSIQEARSLW